MGPEQQTHIDDVAALSRRVLELFHEALPDPGDRRQFERLMAEAGERGMTWIERLEYTASRRHACTG